MALSRALRNLERTVAKGQHAVPLLREALLKELRAVDSIGVDYAEIVDAQNLQPLSDVRSGALVAIAAWVGATRLIDNLLLPPEAAGAAL